MLIYAAGCLGTLITTQNMDNDLGRGNDSPPVQPHSGDLGYYHFQCCWTGQNATDEGPLAASLRIVGNDCGQPSTNGCIFSLPVHCRSPRHFAGYRSLALHHVRHVEISMYPSCLI
ncbi:hypothetical protein CBS63078_397 [Aspergillus niger]|nr:hypothetical protein CBS133816_601 [Aspergillus niger]KAI2940816.1 hypothetical protein CBS63078_397 [Aspergillus niger]KAI3001893.1 hypothetical protein CBS147345_8487 [Aspergillus niger]